MNTLNQAYLKAISLMLFSVFFIIALSCIPANAEWYKIKTDVAQAVLAYDLIEYLTNVFIIDESSKNIYQFDGRKRWSKIGGPKA